MDILEGLNPEQREAVTKTEGYIRVIAGAGTGKTRALTHRYAYLVNEIGILPENILCVTFTNKAANEMKKRIRSLSADADTGYISTFHSFCVSVLQEDIHIVHYPKSFLVLDNPDIDLMLGTVYEERGLTSRHMTFSSARDMIEMKKCIYEPNYYKLMLSLSVEELKEKYMTAEKTDDIIFWGYVYQERMTYALDYNDLINFVLYIFEISEETKLKWQQRLEYIMVDEYQDIDDIQYRLMEALCGGHGNLFIVGDPDQTIYTWRGANVKYIMNFDKAFPDVQTITLNRNYRSTPEILAAANSLIEKNRRRIKKELITDTESGEKPVYHHAKTNALEAERIAYEIKELQERGVKLSEMAILYRAHHLSRSLEDVFIKREIPYTIYSGVQFFERMEIKDALSYLRMAVYKDDLSFLRIANRPKRNIGEKRIKFLKEYALLNSCSLYEALIKTADEDIFKSTKARQFIGLTEEFSQYTDKISLSEMLTLILNKSGYEDMLRLEGGSERLDNLAELKQSIMEYENTCGEECMAQDYLDRVALLTNRDTPDGREAVKMMTVHTAKGLEFPYVFIAGFSDGIFPSKRVADLDGMEEERRLAFVAVTRAEKGLFISEPEGKNRDGSYRYPSRFIFNIKKELLNYTDELDPRLVDEALSVYKRNEKSLEISSQEQFFKIGDRISHAIMGEGEIIGINDQKKAYAIKFDGVKTERFISFSAKLTPCR
ncbi:MAG: UvrD-helicase domain-containing protein [Oscillospiraceae bacterium]|nr:UvrD-helicase domain-containing protein [Oscillospiraceae bacterium]